jgi:hypothetical protein
LRFIQCIILHAKFSFSLQYVARLYSEILDQQLGSGPPDGFIDDDQLIWLGILCAHPQVRCTPTSDTERWFVMML